MELLVYLLITIFTALIFIICLNNSNKLYIKKFKIIATIILCIEIFKFFFTASLFEGATTPSSSLTLSFITIMGILMMIGAFKNNENKATLVINKVLCLLMFVPVLIGFFSDSNYYLTNDVHAILPGIYFFQSGLIIAYGYYVFKQRKNIDLYDVLRAIFVIGVVLGLTAIINIMYDARYIFSDNLYINLVKISAIIISCYIVYFGSIIYFRRGEDNVLH